MTAPLSIRASINIDVTLTRGVVQKATITPRQTLGAGQLLKGASPGQAPRLVESLFMLCAASQRVACEAALGAAQSITITASTRRRWARAINAERVAELLRASVLDWPSGDYDSERRAYGPALRQALQAARSACDEDCDETAIHAALEQSAIAIGAPLHIDQQPQAWFAHLWSAATDLAPLAPVAAEPDFLAREDADPVHLALRQAGRDFAACPHLAGRTAETGVFARHYKLLRRDAGLLAARLQARLLDMAGALEALQKLDGADRGLVIARSAGPGEGFAMVDSPRGFLCHRVELDPSGVIANYDILAPTEWNFHPRGPFASALTAARLNLGEPRGLIAALAALFDPCAPCAINIGEASNA
jgi:uptake hydrogenase large subunit